MEKEPEIYSTRSGRNFTRHRAPDFEIIILLLLTMGCDSVPLWLEQAPDKRFFDLENGIYTDPVVQKEHEKNEGKALCEMTDCFLA